jgi:23S rRNA U2552 (ribose-2'-O)-methylase RlmE/FtsJ
MKGPTVSWQRRTRQPPLIVSTEVGFGPWGGPAAPEVLQQAKDAIAPLEASKRWELIKKMVNPYEIVFTHEDPQFHTSLSLIKPLSRSYFKMVEILDVLQFFERLPKQCQKIKTAHIAEGPGGFIQAVLDVKDRFHKVVGQATAMTLKPVDSRVPGWRRASHFLNRHREIKLIYGADGTGDIYVRANQDSFVAAATPSVQLFTADGGFDFSVDYSIQEKQAFRLVACSATIGVRSLSKDGCLVLKFFDLFSEATQILILLLSRCFQEWTLYKPCLSRPCNSERYFLGRGFKGVSATQIATFHAIQEEAAKDLYPRGLAQIAMPEELAYLQSHITENTNHQLEAFAKARAYAKDPAAWYETQLNPDFQTSLQWCFRYRIPTQLRAPAPIKSPFLTHLVESTSEQAAVPQLQLPGADSSSQTPSDPASQALSGDCSYHNPCHLPSQTGSDTAAQTQAPADRPPPNCAQPPASL